MSEPQPCRPGGTVTTNFATSLLQSGADAAPAVVDAGGIGQKPAGGLGGGSGDGAEDHRPGEEQRENTFHTVYLQVCFSGAQGAAVCAFLPPGR